MPETLQQMLDRLKAQREQDAANQDQRKDEPLELPKGTGFTGRQDYIATPEQINPSRDIYNEAILNSKEDDRILGLDGNPYSFSKLDDATWHDKIAFNDTDGKLLRKTTAIRPIFRGDADKGPQGGSTGEEAQDVRNREESIFGFIPFIGRLASGDAEQNFYYPSKDKNGKYYLKEVKGTEEELSKIGQQVYNAYGAKPFSNNYLTNLYKGFSNTINSTDEMLANMFELGGDLGEASANWMQGNGFKSEEGSTDKYAERVRVRNRMQNMASSWRADDGGLLSGEGFSQGVGNGLGSLVQYALMAGGTRGLLSVPQAFSQGLKGAAATTANGSKLINTMAQLGAGAVLNTGEAYSAAKQAGLDDEDSAVLSLAVGGVNTFLEQALGANVLQNFLSKGGAKEIPEIVLKETGGVWNKLDEATPNILNKVMKSVNKFTETPVVGQAFEEGMEEGLQGLTQKSAQAFYDHVIADKNATPGHGKFGTDMMDSDTWKDVFSDALLGSVVGGMGGVAVRKQNQEEQNSIIPLVANGKRDEINATIDMMHAGGKLNDYQTDAYKNRVNQLHDLMISNKEIFNGLENQDQAAALKTGALQSIEDEFASHRQIDQYMQEIVKTQMQPNVSDAIKESKVSQLNDRINKEKEILKAKTAKVRQFIPNAEGKIPAAEAAKGNPVTPNVDPKKEEEIKNGIINEQRNEELAQQEAEKKQAQNEAAKDVGVPTPNPVVEKKAPVTPAPAPTPKEETKKNSDTGEFAEAKDLTQIEARDRDLQMLKEAAEEGVLTPEEYAAAKEEVYKKYPEAEQEERAEAETLNNQKIDADHAEEERRKEFEARAKSKTEVDAQLAKEEEETRKAQEEEYRRQSHEASGVTEEELKEQEAALSKALEPEATANTETPSGTTNAKFYRSIRTVFGPKDQDKAENASKWIEQLKSGVKNPIKIQITTVGGKKQINLITKVNGKEVQIGYLATTEGTTGLHKNADENTRAAFAHIVALKKAILEYPGTPELDYKVSAGIDAGPTRTGDYTNKPLSELDSRFKFDGAYVIYAQGKRNDSKSAKIGRVLLGTGDDSDFDRPDFPNDAYVLKVRDPEGNIRFIGLETKAPLAEENYGKLTEVINDPDMTDETKRIELNKIAFIPAQGKGKAWNAKFKVTKGDIYISLTPNSTTEGEEFGRLLIPKGVELTADNFLDSLKVSGKVSQLKRKDGSAWSVEDLIGPLREQIEENTADNDVLSKLVPTTTEKLWNINVTAEGIKNSEQDDFTQTPATQEAQKGEPKPTKTDVNNIPSKEEVLKKKPDEDEAAFKIASIEKIQSTDFKQAENNIERILPKFITVADIRSIAADIYADGSTMGAFFNNCIYLADQSIKGTEYHEAFHAVFRRLITNAERQRLIRLGARTANITDADIARFIAQRPNLSEKSKIEIFNLMVEEHLADKFMEHMNNKPNNLFQKIFNHIKDFINWVSGNRNDLDSLFHKIDSGVFRNSELIRKADGSEVEAFKMIPNTSAKESDRIIRLVTALLFKRKEELIKKADGSTYYEQYKDKTDEEIIKLIIDERKQIESLTKEELKKINPDKLAIMGMHQDEDGKIYKNAYLYPTEITDQVLSMKQYFEVNDDVDKDKDTQADRENDKNDNSERNFDQSIFEFGGFGSVSRDIKQFIGLTIYTDRHGVEQVVDFFTAYSAIERALAGIEDFDTMMAKFMKLSKGSDQIKAIYDKTQTTSNNFKTKFQQAFSKRKIEYQQILIDDETGEYNVFNANRLDVGDIQLSRFKSQHDILSPKDQELKAKEAHKALEKYVRSKSDESADNLAEAMKATGMDITAEFLKDVARGENSIFSLNGENNKRGLADDLEQILTQMINGKNPFIDNEKEKGAVTRIKAVANADSLFRDDIINSNFQNAEGKTVYTYVLPSHVVATAQDIQEGKLEKKFQDEFYQLNPLIQLQAKNKNILSNLKLTVFNGIREKSDAEGLTFKHIDSKTQIVSQHALFKAGYLAPFVFEAKSTSALIPVPDVKRFYEGGKVNPSAINAMYNFVKQDVLTNTRTLEELESLPDTELIENYHFKAYDKNNKPVRYFVLDEKGKPVPSTKEEMFKNVPRSKMARGLQTVQFPFLNKYTIEELASKEKEQDIKNELEEFVQEQIKQYKELLKLNDLDLYDTKNGDINLFLTEKDSETYKNIDDYLGEFLLKDFIFANAYAQLHRGSEAIYKDAVDITKRAAGQMAAGFPLISEKKNFKVAMIADDKFFINPKTMERAESGAEVNATDAQGYVSPKRFKEIMKGLGRLDSAAEKQIDALIAGEKIDWDPELFTANSIKNVYFDGTTYIKTSIFPLFREFTSKKEDGKWVAQEGRERYHNLIEQMENNDIDEIYHESACKLVKKRKNFPNKDGHYDQPLMTIDLENRFWRLQVENPSGKTAIVDGTQLIQLIDSEMDNDKEFTFNGKKVSVGELRDTYQQMLSDVRQDSMMKASNFLDIMVNGESLFISKLQDTLAESGADNNTIEFFQQLAKEKAEFRYSTDLPNINAKFQELFLSHFTKAVFRQKTAGSKFSLVTSSGYLHEGRPLKIHKVKDGTLHYAECVISEEILHSYGITKEEFENNTPKEAQDEILTMLGFRIPTQSHHSMIPFKVVGWLPAYYGSVVIAPAEITYLSGADYDIDSLFVQRKEFKVVGKEGKKRAIVYNGDKPVDQLWRDFTDYELGQKDAQKVFKKLKANNKEASYEDLIEQTLEMLGLPATKEEFMESNQWTNAARYNKMLDTRFAFLNNPEIHESLFTPASLDSLKDIAKDISAVTGKSEDSVLPYNWASSRFNHWLNNSVGKANVGNAANANISSAWLTRYKVVFKSGGEDTPDFRVRFDGKTYAGYADNMEHDIQFEYKDGKPVSISKEPLVRRKADSLSTLVSAMTDNAKERLAAKLNLTQDNLSTFANMVGLGMGLNRSMLFASQPVLIELTNRLISANSIIRSKDRADEVLDNMLNEIEKQLGYIPSGDVTSEDMLKYLKYDMDPKNKEGLEAQYKVLQKFNILSARAEDAGKINKLLSTNKSVGVDFQEFDSILEALETVIGENYSMDIHHALAQDKNLQQNLYSVKKIDQKLSEYFMSRTEGFKKTISHVKSLGVKRANIGKLYTDLVTFYGMQKLNKTIKGGPIENLKPLITSKEDNIVAKKDAIIANHPDLKDNLFLRQLTSQTPDTKGEKNPYYRLEFNGRMKTDPRFMEKLTDGYRELQNHPEEAVREFSKDLAKYLIVKDNLKFVNNSFIRLMPPKTLETYSKILKEIKDITSKDMEGSNIFETEYGKAMHDYYGKTWYEMQNDFERLWYSQKENAKSLNQFVKNLPKEAKSGVSKGPDNTMIVNLKGKESAFKSGQLPQIPKFFANRILTQEPYGMESVLMVWERDRYIKDGDKKVGGVYKRVKMNGDKFQSPYHIDQNIKESKAEKLEAAKDESNLIEKLPSKAESVLVTSPNGDIVASINDKGEFKIMHDKTEVKPGSELFNKLVSTYNEIAKLYKKACNS